MDWTASYSQTFEVYEVDPSTWGDIRRIENVTSCSVTRDSTTSLIESATIETDEQLGECYLRIYMVAVQNESSERICFGTFLVQTPSTSFDGKVTKTTLDAYSPLIELNDTKPEIGFTVSKGANIMEQVCELADTNMRPPVVSTTNSTTLYADYTAEFSDSWLNYLETLMSNADYEFGLDEMSRVIFMPVQKLSSMQPRWTYTDDNSSIIQADISVDRDLYGVPNVVEVYYSSSESNLYSIVENTDINSVISVPNRGRKVVYREQNPSFSGVPTQEMIDRYAKDLLESKSTLKYTVSYTHGYCPVRVGDCVRLNYERAGLTDIKALVTNQSISCQTGITVSETAVYTAKLWEA